MKTRKIAAVVFAALFVIFSACTPGGTQNAAAPDSSDSPEASAIPVDSASPSDTAAPENTEAPGSTFVPYVFNPDTDVDNRFANAYCSIVERENMFVWAAYGDSAICFFDKEADYGGVLCSKPECDHSPDTAGCNGGIPVKSICCCEDKLYLLPSWSTKEDKSWHIFKMNLDSTGREVFMTIPDAEDGSVTLMNMYIHRGRMYFVNHYSFVEDGVPMEKYALLSCDLASHNAAELKPVFEFESKSWFVSRLFFAGDRIYLFATPGIDGHYKLMVWCYDTVTGETSTAADVILDDDYFTASDFWVTQEGEILVCQSAVIASQNVKIYKIVDNELEVYMEFEETDGPWHGTAVFDDAVAALRLTGEKSPRQYEVWIRDHEGNTIYKGPLCAHDRDGNIVPSFDNINWQYYSHDRIMMCVSVYTTAGETEVADEVYYFVEYEITDSGLEEKTLVAYDMKTGFIEP
ncbi:MAG: hypothetical protein IJM20_04315 [Clostridia bacterium]|nr:hypothetical protein [Clostridia bacterium]